MSNNWEDERVGPQSTRTLPAGTHEGWFSLTAPSYVSAETRGVRSSGEIKTANAKDACWLCALPLWAGCLQTPVAFVAVLPACKAWLGLVVMWGLLTPVIFPITVSCWHCVQFLHALVVPVHIWCLIKVEKSAFSSCPGGQGLGGIGDLFSEESLSHRRMCPLFEVCSFASLSTVLLHCKNDAYFSLPYYVPFFLFMLRISIIKSSLERANTFQALLCGRVQVAVSESCLVESIPVVASASSVCRLPLGTLPQTISPL